MTKTELLNKLVTRHFPERAWVKQFNGKWTTRLVTVDDIENRRQWVLKVYADAFKALAEKNLKALTEMGV